MDTTDKPTVLLIDKLRWIIIYASASVITSLALSADIGFGFGFILPMLVVGMVISSLLWISVRRTWRWYNWMNVASYIMVAILVALAFVNA